MKSTIVTYVMLGAFSQYCFAVTNIVPNSTIDLSAHRQGVIQEITPGSTIKIDGHVFIFSLPLVKVYDEKGRLAKKYQIKQGMEIGYSIQMDGSKQRINELWIIEKK